MLPPGVVYATEEHVYELADTMAEADRAEAWAASHATPLEALMSSYAASRDTRQAWIVNGRVLAMWGVGFVTPLDAVGMPWMLGAADLPKHGRAFARGSKIIAAEWHKRYPMLRNFVDARHTVAVRWVEWMGFTVSPAVPYGTEGFPFHPFEYVREQWVQ